MKFDTIQDGCYLRSIPHSSEDKIRNQKPTANFYYYLKYIQRLSGRAINDVTLHFHRKDAPEEELRWVEEHYRSAVNWEVRVILKHRFD